MTARRTGGSIRPGSLQVEEIDFVRVMAEVPTLTGRPTTG
jgi:hypothetical protein